MNASGADLLLGFGGLAFIVLAVSLLVSGYSTMAVLLSELMNFSWSALGTDIAVNMACGAAGGLVIGWLRVRRPARLQVVDELVSAAASPDVVSAAAHQRRRDGLARRRGRLRGVAGGLWGRPRRTNGAIMFWPWADRCSWPCQAPAETAGDFRPMAGALLSSLFAFVLVVCVLTVLAAVVLQGLLATAAQMH